ncbi:hypothetical protein BBJ29_009861, partial [Phytophthora kernoviae]
MAQGPAAFHDFVAQNIEPALGHTLPQIEVRCKHVSLVVEVSVVQQSSSAKFELPTILNSIKHAVRKFTAHRSVTKRHILNRVSAVFEPGTITLLLGQPGSGKSSLLKMLSGQFPMEKNISIEGEITYNGRSQEELLTRLPQLAAYVPQHDKHFAAFSVKETLEFAHRCCPEELVFRCDELLTHGSPEEYKTAKKTAQALSKHYPQVITEQLGLQNCRDTVLGNELRRGVSGGERRRVTTGEMEFGMKYATFMDEISTGLDSAATFDIVSTQRNIAKKLHKTVVIALLQPAPEVFELFDNVMLLNDGEVMYHGLREQAVPYFESLGFVCPPDRDVADYLLDLGTDEQYQYEVSKAGNHPSLPMTPRLVSEFAEAFQASRIYHETERALEAPLCPDRVRDTKEHIDKMPEFRESFWASAWTLTRRQTTIALRNTAFIRVRAFMVVVMGLIYGSTFYQIDPENMQVSLGVLFQGTMFLQLGQASQIPSFIAAREIYYKQRRANFYRTASFALGCSVALIPTAMGECLVFGSLVYWLCGFIADASCFLFFMLCMILTNMVFCAWFFCVTAMSPNFNIAKPMSTFSIVFFIVFAGFVVPMAVNQYRSPIFDVCVYAGEDYCAQFNMTMGEYSLSQYDVPSDKMWIWTGVAFLAFAYAFFMGLGSYVLEYKRYDAAVAVVAVVTGIAKNEDLGCKEEQLQHPEGGSSYILASISRVGSDAFSPEECSTDFVVLNLREEPDNTFIPVTLAFKDLWYSVPLPRHKQESIDLLKGISGYALPGTMTALMGSSGAGKTTLMDVIAGRKTGGKISGEILLNGYPATELAIRRCTGYCEQQDIHSEGATFREALTFSAFLRQDSSVSERAKLASVEECLDLLNMRAIADKIVRGSSQEQMKRLTIGVELAAQPSVLFLDEPTSGLDAHSAKVIMDGVRKVADSGRTIVCTIHQPSSDVFFLFDSLLLLKRGGEMVFFGELDNAESDDRECGHLIDYFEAIQEVPRLPAGQNPATWMLECIGAGVAGAGEKPTMEAAAN